MTRTIMLALVVMATGACRQYAQVSMHNAPSNVDLATPLPHENGDPARFEPLTDPGSEYLSVWTCPYVIGGLGRGSLREGGGETGVEVRFERADADLVAEKRAFGVIAGLGIAQWSEAPTVVPAAFYGELSYRPAFPYSLGAGLAYYSDTKALGAQITLRLAEVVVVRTRLMSQTGLELMGGIEIPMVWLFGRSK